MKIDRLTGNVGIGTTDPKSKLNIVGAPPSLRLTYHGGAYTDGSVYMELRQGEIEKT